jgi:hypothetical protein
MQVKIYSSIQDMTGIGEEWLLNADGNVLAVFIDGDLRCEVFRIAEFQSQEVTKIVS